MLCYGVAATIVNLVLETSCWSMKEFLVQIAEDKGTNGGLRLSKTMKPNLVLGSVFIWWIQGRKVKDQVANHSTTRVPHFIIAFPVSWFKVVITHIGMGGEVNPSMAQSLWMRNSNWSTLEQVWHAFQVFVLKSVACVSFLGGPIFCYMGYHGHLSLLFDYSIMLYFDAIRSGDDRTLLNGSQEPCHLCKRTSSLSLCISRGRMSELGWWQGHCQWLMLIQTQMAPNSSLQLSKLAGTPLSLHNINYLVFQTITSWGSIYHSLIMTLSNHNN